MKQFSLVPVIHSRELPPEVLGEVYSEVPDDNNLIISLDWDDKDQYYLLKDFLERVYKCYPDAMITTNRVVIEGY